MKLCTHEILDQPFHHLEQELLLNLMKFLRSTYYSVFITYFSINQTSLYAMYIKSKKIRKSLKEYQKWLNLKAIYKEKMTCKA